MVRAIEQEQENYKSRLFHFKGMQENNAGNGGRHAKSLSVESASKLDEATTGTTLMDKLFFRGKGSNNNSNNNSNNSSNDQSQKQKTAAAAPALSQNEKNPKSRFSRDEEAAATAAAKAAAEAAQEAAAAAQQAIEKLQHDMEQMKERFSKLLLGEDMSGGGKGVSSALAISNAITNLAASVFGEQSKLEPMSAERKARWKKEIDWLLSVSDYIVEFVPKQQKSKDGSTMEIMTTQQRTDLHMNIPALRKLDAMLIDCLDNFKDQSEFYYVSKDAPDSEKGVKRKDDKWWLPTAKVPANGLSETTRKFLQYQKDCVNQVLKAAMAINAQVISEMEIPENYIESLPKNGRASLGDSIYRSITVEYFDPDQFLSTMDLSSEHKILDLKNRIEASIVIWKRKMNQKDGKSTWSSAVSLEKRELFEERAETILLILKQRFPGTPQSALDISKIQYNGDVGQAILEGYSRILESLAFTVLSRIEDVLYADFVTKNPSKASFRRSQLPEFTTKGTSPSPNDDPDKTSSVDSQSAMTLLDFMGWEPDQNENDAKKNGEPITEEQMIKDAAKECDMKFTQKIANIVTHKKVSYLENLGGIRSPTARH